MHLLDHGVPLGECIFFSDFFSDFFRIWFSRESSLSAETLQLGYLRGCARGRSLGGALVGGGCLPTTHCSLKQLYIRSLGEVD